MRAFVESVFGFLSANTAICASLLLVVMLVLGDGGKPPVN
jgi:hypothetical protein